MGQKLKKYFSDVFVVFKLSLGVPFPDLVSGEIYLKRLMI